MNTTQTGDASVPIQPITPSQFLNQSAMRFGERPALVFMGFSITFNVLTDLVNRFAQALTDLGVRPGDRVAIMLPNMPQTVVTNYAVLRMGAIAVMVNPLYTVPELTHLLNDSGAETLILLDGLIDKAKAAWPDTALNRLIVCHVNDLIPVPDAALPPGTYHSIETAKSVFSYRDLQEDYPVGHPFADQSRWESAATLIYTGGTTGPSKGAVLTNANMSSCIQLVRRYWNAILEEGQERQLAIYPMFHVGGYVGIQLFGLSYGTTLVLVPRPDSDTLIRLLETETVTALAGVPTIFVGLINHPRWASLDLSSLKILSSSAAPMAGATYSALTTKCPDATFLEIWGMTELSAFGTCTPVGTGQIKLGSAGCPLPGCAVKIMDLETGTTEVPAGRDGEICYRGPQVMHGYWNKPDATAEVLREGWLYSGDVGHVDEEGWLYVVDRKKDMIIAGGYNIFPTEIDDVLYSHPAILEACCIGIPDAYRGETVKAFIVLKPGEMLSADEVTAFCREQLAAYKIPKQIEFLDELPKSAVGKILRRELLKQTPANS
jgi:long-chain acyl-CoA synthetase